MSTTFIFPGPFCVATEKILQTFFNGGRRLCLNTIDITVLLQCSAECRYTAVIKGTNANSIVYKWLRIAQRILTFRFSVKNGLKDINLIPSLDFVLVLDFIVYIKVQIKLSD